MRRILDLAITGLVALLYAGEVVAAPAISWNNAQGNGLWNVESSTNWTSPDGRFSNGDEIGFGDTAAGTVTISGANVAPASVTFANSAGKNYTIASAAAETLTAAGGLIVTGSGNVTINSVIAGATPITHSGSGSLTLGGINTFSGGIVVKAGSTLVAGNNAALGSTAQATALTIEDGGTLNVGNSLLSGYGAGSIKVRGDGVDGNGAIVKSTGNNYNVFNGELDFTGDAIIRNTLRLDIDGPLANNTGARVTLTKTGGQTLFLANTIPGSGFDWDIRQGQITMEGNGDSSVKSSFTVNTGTILQKNQNHYTVAGNLVLSGGTIQVDGTAHTWTFSGGLHVTDGSAINPSGSSSVMKFSGALSGAGSMLVGSPGTVNFAGTASGHTGGIVLDSGSRLEINGNYSGSTGTIRIRSGATLSGSGTWGGNVIIEEGGTLNGGSLTITGTVTDAPVTFTAFSEVSGKGSPPEEWKFYWNAPTNWAIGTPGDLSSGAITDRNSWKPLVWSGSMWTADGDGVNNNPPSSFLRITATGGHTGAFGATRELDRYAISAFTIAQAGDYELLLGKISTQTNGNGVWVRIFLNGSLYHELVVPNNNAADFSYIFNGLALNDEIAVAVGANGNSSSDTFALDYRIALLKPEYANPLVINVADYGAVGDGVTDDGPAVLNAISAWKNVAGPAALLFETNKTYYLSERTDHKSYFLLYGLNDKVVEGNGAKLILTPSNRGFTIEGCDNIVVRNFSVDYSPLSFSQGVVTSINAAAGTFVFDPLPGYPDPILEGNKTWGTVYDPATQNLRTEAGDHIEMDRLTNLGNGTFEFHAVANHYSKVAATKTGDLFVFRAFLDKGIPGDGHWASIYGNGTVAFDQINLQCAPAFAFKPGENTKPCLFRHITISPPEGSGRLVSAFGDGFHCPDNRFGPIIEDGYFTYLMDDTIHIKSTGFQISGVTSNAITVGTSGHRVGDKFRFLDQVSETVLGEATVTAINGSQLTFNALPSGVLTGQYVHNRSRGNAGFVVQNNYFGKKRRVAAILRGGDGKVLNNIADGNDGFRMRDSDFFNETLEGATAENILFQGNTIRNTRRGLWILSSYTNRPINNIRIFDNVFEGLPNLEINGAANLQLLGNQFWATPIAKLDRVENVTIGHSTDVNGNFLPNEAALLTGSYIPGEITVDLFDYNDWTAKAGLIGDDALALTYDADSDGMDNQLEYALGGNPTNADASVVMPTFKLAQAGDWFYHIHNERTGDSSLKYTVQLSSNLVSGIWTTSGVGFVGQSGVANNFKTVTNRTDVGEGEFIRLKIEKQ